ncbi:MAG: DUF2283 domain-containing protein [Candidatus Marinimicrobia bacterium]|nr:DUF2283 domain-containing protein [Candidatus Neomarinimicrobiota bacterium]
MKIYYSKEADAFYLRFNDNQVAESVEVAQDIVIDYDSEGGLVAIEVLFASEKANVEELVIQAFNKVMVEKEPVG